MKPFIALFAILFTLSAAPVPAAQEFQWPVSVSHSGNDTVGKRLAFAVKEALRRSSGFQLVSSKDSLIQIEMITLDPEANRPTAGSWTVASVVITVSNLNKYEPGKPHTWYPIFLTSTVVTAGASRVTEMADSVLATLDSSVAEYQSEVKPH